MATVKMWILPAALAFLAACGTPPDTEPASSQPGARAEPSVGVVGDTTLLELPLGSSANNGVISVRFDAVTSDSRCPTAVECVWEGNAGIRLTVTDRNETEVYVVNSASSPTTPTWVRFVGWTIGYRDLIPHPTSTAPTDPDAYVATIAILDTRDAVPTSGGGPPVDPID